MPRYELWERFKNGNERHLPHYGRRSLNSSKEPIPEYVQTWKIATGDLDYYTLAYGADHDMWQYAVPDYTRGVIQLSEERRARMFWRVVPDKRWREREAGRLSNGTYISLPWFLKSIPDHYAHIAEGDGKMVAFTETPEKGEIDRQTRMKPGRYLTRFYPHLSPDEVRDLAIALERSVGMQLATTPDEIEQVYKHGPHSCMAGESRDFNSPVHPARVYGAGDLAVAYLSTTAITDPDFHATARAVVWPEKKLYSRLYGDGPRLEKALTAAGYQPGRLYGAKLLRIPHREAFVCPYIDATPYVVDRGEHLEIIDPRLTRTTNYFLAESTDGLIGYADTIECDNCGDAVDGDGIVSVRIDRYTHQNWCEGCRANSAFLCHGYDEWVSSEVTAEYEVTLTTLSGRRPTYTYSELWCEDHFAYDGMNGRYVDEPTIELMDTGETTTLAHAKAHCFQCADNGGWYSERPTNAEGNPARLVTPRSDDPAQTVLPLLEDHPSLEDQWGWYITDYAGPPRAGDTVRFRARSGWESVYPDAYRVVRVGRTWTYVATPATPEGGEFLAENLLVIRRAEEENNTMENAA
jgi:hypothetical protein